ncbi:hypothetical protein PENTCL1PPCAC_14776, partial [Pristionchus entomophagus]
ATGANYEVVSCHGCKSFFRRAIQHRRRFVCEQQGNCEKECSAMRLRCRACRFARCLEAGMNAQGVGSIKEATTASVNAAKKAWSDVPISAPTPMECRIDRLIEELIYLDAAHQKLRRSQYNPTHPAPPSVEWCVIGTSRMAIDFG